MPTSDDRHQMVLRAILLEHKAAAEYLSGKLQGREKKAAHREWRTRVVEVSKLLKA